LEVAVVTLTVAAGGSSRLSAVLLVYVSTEEGITLEKAFELGTAAYGGLRDVRFSQYSLIIERYNREDAGTNGKALADAVCCPSTFTQQVFTRNNNQLLMISEKKFPNEFSYAKDLLIKK
jgi:hypothetical protein